MSLYVQDLQANYIGTTRNTQASKWVSHSINDVIDDLSLSLYNVAINYSQLMWIMNTILHSLYYCDTHYNMPVEGMGDFGILHVMSLLFYLARGECRT